MNKKNNRNNLFLWILIILVCFLIDFLYNYTSGHGDFVESPMVQVHFIDVGQADATLIQGENFNILIDTGENSAKIIEYIEGLGIKKFDYIIATHPHSDHIGGMADIIKTYEIGAFIMPDVIHTTLTFEKMIDALEESDCDVLKADEMDFFEIEGIIFKILNPDFEEYDNLNNYSVVLKMEAGENSFLFMADAESVVEKKLLSSAQSLKCDVLKAGHHGSSTSSSAAFIEAVKPKFAVISCGENNSYGHPHSEVIKTIENINAEILRTDISGTIIIYSDGKTLFCTREK